MGKLLEKALKDAIKEDQCTFGSKQVVNAIKNSKLVVVSQSLEKNISEKISEDAKKSKVPTIQFQGSSVALGRLCGLQFRVSSVSFTSISDANITSIIKEAETE